MNPRELFDFDYEKKNLVWKIARCTRIKVGNVAGCLRPDGYRQLKIDYKVYLAHHVSWAWHRGEWSEHQLDHINRDKDDNRIENLRISTMEGLSDHQANHQNLGICKNNTSGYTGVSWDKSRQKWSAKIWFKDKCIYLGRFDQFKDACLARENAKAKYHKFQPLQVELNG